MTMRLAQPNFSKGELAPQLYGRFDVDAYQSGLARARNVMVLKYGGISRRPGTMLVAQVIDDSQPNRLIPFQFSLDQTFVLEMGQGYMSPCSLGGRVLETEMAITAITNATAAQVTIAYHGLAPGDFLYIQGVVGGLGAVLNDRAWPVTAVIDADNVTIGADTSAAPGFAGCTGGTTRTAPPVVVPPPVVTPVVTTPTTPVTYSGAGGMFGGIYRGK